MSNKIIVVGPSNSGKSVFVEGLRIIFEDRGIDCGYVDLDLWGSTFLLLSEQETLGQRKKRKEKLKVTKFMMDEKIKEFESKSNPLVLADTPGQISDDLDNLIEPSTMGIIVCRKEWIEELEKWRAYLDRIGIELIGIVHSVINSNESVTSNGFIESIVSDLDRDNIEPSNGTRSFGDRLLRKIGI